MTKQEVLERLCQLTTDVAGYLGHGNYPSDCFCEENKATTNFDNFSFSPKILEFLEEAVEEKINHIPN